MVIAIVLQFNSFRRALLTFMSIPLIFVGIPYGLLLTGQPLSFFGRSALSASRELLSTTPLFD